MENNIDINNFTKLVQFVEMLNLDYEAKKSVVFTRYFQMKII